MKINRWILLGMMVAGGFCAKGCDDGGGTFCLAQAPVAVSSIDQAKGLLVGTYHSPEMDLEKKDLEALGAAQEEIDLAAFSLTDPAIIDALKDRAVSHHVKEHIYLDRGELQAECRGDVLCARSPLGELIALAPAVEIKVKFSKVLMHLKSYTVDGKLVRDGSANFSEQGEKRQDNSLTFSTDDTALVGFQVKFAAMWARPDNLTVAQAIGVKVVQPALSNATTAELQRHFDNLIAAYWATGDEDERARIHEDILPVDGELARRARVEIAANTAALAPGGGNDLELELEQLGVHPKTDPLQSGGMNLLKALRRIF